METSKDRLPEENVETNDDHSLKGAFYSALIFVGGGIVFFILLLFIIYMVRA